MMEATVFGTNRKGIARFKMPNGNTRNAVCKSSPPTMEIIAMAALPPEEETDMGTKSLAVSAGVPQIYIHLLTSGGLSACLAETDGRCRSALKDSWNR